MCRLNIILVEDDKMHRESLHRALQDDFGHEVVSFRDLKELQTADRDHQLRSSFKSNQPLVVVMDCMLAKELSEEAGHAPRWTRPEPLPLDRQNHYVDDSLGLRVAQSIRDGEFEDLPAMVPILIFTARRNPIVAEEVEQLKSAGLLVKPKFSKRVHEAICSLVESSESGSEDE